MFLYLKFSSKILFLCSIIKSSFSSVRYGVDGKSSVKSYNSEVYGNAETKKAFDLMRRNWEKWWD
jgi:hypothetical protein